MRSNPQRKQCTPRSGNHGPRPKERCQRRPGSTDCTAANAKRPAARHEVRHACPPRSTRTPSRMGRTGRSGRTAERSPPGSHATARPPLAGAASREHGRTVRSRRTLIPASVPVAVLTKQTRQRTVEVGRQGRGPGRRRVRPNDDRRSGRQRADPVLGDMPQLPLHPIADDRVPDRLRYDEAHSGRCLSSGTTQVDDERSATGTSSPTHCGGEVTAVAHSVSGGKHP